MLRHKPWELGCKAMRNVGVTTTHEQEPQPWGAFMGFFILVLWVRGQLGILDLVL